MPREGGKGRGRSKGVKKNDKGHRDGGRLVNDAERAFRKLLLAEEISKAEKLFVVGFDCHLNTEGLYKSINFINDCDIVKRFYDYYESK